MCAVRSHWYLWTVPTDVTNKSPLIAGVGVLAGTEADGTLLMSNEHCWHRAPRGVWWDSRIAHVWPSLSSTHSFLLLLLRGLNFFISPPESSASFLLLVPAPLSSISFLSAASPPFVFICCSGFCLEYFWLSAASFRWHPLHERTLLDCAQERV